MKKILLSLLLIAGMIGIVRLARTGAFFQDTETGTGAVASGPLDLLVNGQNDPVGIVQIQDIKPGFDLVAHKTLRINDNPGRVYMHLKDLVDDQGVQTEPEILEESQTVPKSDIQNFLTYDLTVGDNTLIATADGILLPDAVSCWIPLGQIPGAQDVDVAQSFHMDPAVTNWAQGDRLTFTEEFLALQIDDPTIPTTGTGRVWNPNTKKCENVASPIPTPIPSNSPTPTPTPSTTPVPSVSPTPTPTPSSEPFVDAVTSVDGTFGHCCDVSDLSSDPNVAAALITGAPDSPPNFNFIQISDNSVVTAKFVDNKAMDGPGADIRIHVYDALFPASALIEVSQDCSTFFSLGIHPDTANVDLDISGTGLSFVKCVRLTDQVAGGDPFPLLGFDLDAIEALHSLPDP